MQQQMARPPRPMGSSLMSRRSCCCTTITMQLQRRSSGAAKASSSRSGGAPSASGKRRRSAASPQGAPRRRASDSRSSSSSSAPRAQQQQEAPQPARIAYDDGRLQFGGQLLYATTPQQSAAWGAQLLSLAASSQTPVVVGFDTEAPVVWRDNKTTHMPTSLMQLCYHAPSSSQPTCLLLQLSRLGLDDTMRRILEHKNVVKVGIGLANDLLTLERDFDVVDQLHFQSCVDLDTLARACGMPRPLPAAEAQQQQESASAGVKAFPRHQPWGLAPLTEAVSGHRLHKSKKIAQSSWSFPLTDKQIEYAAADAYAGLVVYSCLQLRWVQHHQQQQQQAAGTAGASSSSSSGGSNPLQLAMDQGPEAVPLAALTNPALWQQFAPAAASQQAWATRVLAPASRVCLVQRERVLGNASARVDVEDDWLCSMVPEWHD